MPWALLDATMWLPAFALALFRIGGLLVAAPIVGSSMVPARIRIALAMTLALLVMPMVRAQMSSDASLGLVIAGSLAEIGVGLVIGMGVTLLSLGPQLAGLMIGQQAGLALAEVLDPNQDTSGTLMSQLYSMVFFLVFLAAGGHRAMMAAVLDSYQAVPLFGTLSWEGMIVFLSELLSASFVLGVRLAGPVLIALFLTQTCLGFLSRTIPQINILTVGFTLRTLVALAVAGAALMASRDLLLDAIWEGLALIRVAFGLGLPIKGLAS